MIFWKWENYGDHKKASGCHRRQEMNRQNAEDFYRSGNTLSHTVMTDECHYACMQSCFSCVLPSATPWTTALQTPLSKGFSRQEYWKELPCPPPGDLPDTGIEFPSLISPISYTGRWVLHQQYHLGSPYVIISSVQSLRGVRLSATPWTATCQASLSITNSQSWLNLMSTESVMSSNHLILCHPLLLPPSIFPSIRVFSNESVLPIRWPKYWSFSFSSSPSNEDSRMISIRMNWLYLLAGQGTLKSLLQHHSSKASILWHSVFFTVQLSHPYMTTGKTTALTYSFSYLEPVCCSMSSSNCCFLTCI